MQPVAASVACGWAGSDGGAHGQTPPSPDPESVVAASTPAASPPPASFGAAPGLVHPPAVAATQTHAMAATRENRNDVTSRM
jgi:hypothetical protein